LSIYCKNPTKLVDLSGSYIVPHLTYLYGQVYGDFYGQVYGDFYGQVYGQVYGDFYGQVLLIY